MSFHTSKVTACQGKVASLERSKPLQSLLLFGFLARMVVALWNGFFGPSFGAEADANSFHLKAVDFARTLDLYDFSPGEIFTYFLGTFYYLTTASLFLGSLLSCVIWLVSAKLLVKIMSLLSFSPRMGFRAMFIFALLPSSVLFTSVTLREPYQLLSINLAIYSILEIALNKSKVHWLLLFLAVICAGSLHATLLASGIFLVSVPILFSIFYRRKKISTITMPFLLLMFFIVIFCGYSSLSSLTKYGLDEGLIVAIESYQKGGLGYLDEARAFYKTNVEIDGVMDLLRFIPTSLLQYLFEPMPWRISALVDIELLLENILRAWLIWSAWVGLRSVHAYQRGAIPLLFISYLVIENIWALGTINWGTAVRHHIPSMGILVVTAFALSESFQEE